MKKAAVLALLVACLAAATPAWAWNFDMGELDPYAEGKKLYDADKGKEALPLYEKALALHEKDAQFWFELASIYQFSVNEPQKALAAWKKYETIAAPPWAGYWYRRGVCELGLGQFADAAGHLASYVKLHAGDLSMIDTLALVVTKLRYAQESPAIRAAPPTMSPPEHLAALCSEYPDYMPQLDASGKTLYFVSTRKGFDAKGFKEGEGGSEDIYRAVLNDKVWGSPELLPAPINSDANEGAPAFAADGQTLVFIACGRKGGVGSCDLWTSALEGKDWSAPKNFGGRVNSDDWDSQPTLSSDGGVVIFASTRKGGEGGHDLWMTRKNRHGMWSKAVGLSNTLNTPFDELSPFLSSDGKTLYFGSNGHPGFGGYDLFVSRFDDGKWGEPQNLGAPLNSAGDDLYFTVGGSGEWGYFASDRAGTKGKLDLFRIAIPESMRPQPTVIVKGTVTSAKDGKPVAARILIEDLKSGDLIATMRSNADTGSYLVVLPAGRDYSVSASREGFFFHSDHFDVPKEAKFTELVRDILLKPIEKGSRVILNNVFFDTGKATLRPESRVELGKAVDLMRGNRTMKVEIGGHTDNVGKKETNLKLSHDRALAVREFLVLAGVEPDRLMAKGYGDTMPVASNDTDEGKQANRRTEFVIVDF